MNTKKGITILIVALVVLATGLSVVSLIFDISTPKIQKPIAQNGLMEQAWAAISYERMIAFLEKLTAINPHAGWRGSATTGENEAFNFVERSINNNNWLIGQGMTLERESFGVFLSTQDNNSKVILTINGKTVEIPADSMRGNRDDPALAIRMDSDGQFNDMNLNPVKKSGTIIVVNDKASLESIVGIDQTGKILMVDYGLVDTGMMTYEQATPIAQKLVDLNPEAILLVTHFSNVVGESHGTFIGDGGGGFQRVNSGKSLPVLFIELENLKAYGIANWVEMKKVSRAEVTWDTDVSNPGTSENLIVHIPGKDASKAVLISAHIDSAQSPGALDDGSGSAVMMEIINVLNDLKIQPDIDLFIAWYGSEELGLYGSTYFTTTHSDLINRLQANVQVDCLSRPLDGLDSAVTLSFSHSPSDDLASDPLAKYLSAEAEKLVIPIGMDVMPYSSDNGSLSAFNIPNVNIILESEQMAKTYGGVWYAGHLHDPYDTVSLFADVKSQYIGMAKLAMSAALIPSNSAKLVERAPTKKAVFISTYTQSPHMTPAGLPGFSLELMNTGYEINVIPYGMEFTQSDLKDASIVVVLPTYDYAATPGNPTVTWSMKNAGVVDQYLKNGGTVVVVNSAHRLKFANRTYDENEDWDGLNPLVGQWGVQFIEIGADGTQVVINGSSSLTNGVSTFTLDPKNAVAFSMQQGAALAGTDAKTYLGDIAIGKGRLIVLGDLTALGDGNYGLNNLQMVKNIAGLK